MNHPKGGIRSNKSKSQAKAPEIRDTYLRKSRYFVLKVVSITAANAIVQVHTSITKSTIMALCAWNSAAPELWYFNPTRVSKNPKKKPKRAINPVKK